MSTTHMMADLLRSALPCVLADRSGMITAVSAGMRAALPDAVGRPLRQVLGIRAPSTADGAALPGLYGDADRGLTPVMVHLMGAPQGDGFMLAVVNDGTAFRQAEESRWQDALYGVLRVSAGGFITFVNPWAVKLLAGPAPNPLAGCSLAALVVEDDAAVVHAALAACAEQGTPASLDVALRSADPMVPGESCRILLTPDRMADGRTIGVIAVLQSRRVERARDEIKQAALHQGHWKDRLDQVLAVLQTVIPFDRATFGIYAEDVKLFRPVHVAPASVRAWPVLWMKLRADVRAWLQSGRTWSEDLELWVRNHPELVDDPVIRQHREDGVRAFVTLPVFEAAGPTASLSLASCRPDVYDRASLLLLDDLDIAEVLRMFEREIADGRAALVRRLQTLIRNAVPLLAAVQLVADELRGYFAWDQLFIVAVKHAPDAPIQVLPLAESLSPGGDGAYGDADRLVRQGMIQAMLSVRPDAGGLAPLIVDDCAREGAAYSDQAGAARFRSVITYPIRFNGRRRWVLQVGAIVPNAFHGPDMEVLDEVVAKLETELERAYRAEVNRILLDRTPQGVVVVGSGGMILEANRAARERLLGWETQAGRLEEYAVDSDSRDVLSGKVADTSRRIQLNTAFGRVSTALATRYDLAEAYQASLWFLTDLDDLDWNVEYRYLREVVHDVAQQTRGPLILASTVLQRSLRRITDPAARAICEAAIEQVLAEIGRADITFERLAEGLSAIKEPKRESVPVDLRHTLESFVAALPERDRRHIDLALPAVAFVVLGDAVRLRFVLRSIVGHLLRCRPDEEDIDARIRIDFAADTESVTLTLGITGLALADDTGALPPQDPLWTWMQYARDDSSLALEAVEHVLASHGAVLSKQRLQQIVPGAIPVWARFDISFPLPGRA